MQTFENTFAQSPDLDLVNAFQCKKDSQAFTTLYNRYYPKVEQYCLKSLNDMQAAQDATQEVFIKVFERLSTLKNPELWVAWLFSVTRNVVLNIHKKNDRLRMENVDEFNLPAEDNSGIEALQEKEHKLAVLPKLLNTPDGRILKMKYVNGLSIEQMSNDMHLKESAVKMRLLRARHHIINMYENDYPNRA
ncbi:MAG: sigma-70 family RNA polymerase sigma factor [Saprospiraceae bacterium]|nr:sigma-70 family RNA polymerase sigma factor [Saprospiraceae bacterium]MCB9323786.1 sigma-70 family RNA polymerase sigma factor [Lewinellaceae bacterium]